MKNVNSKRFIHAAVSILLLSILLVSGCETFRPIQPRTTPNPPAKQSAQNDFVITYNYGDTDKVQLSANNIVLKVGQKLVLQPAPGLTKSTRFSSSGEHFFGDIMKQETDQKETSKVIFTAIKPGKGKLQIIPNNTETDRATDLWVTVQ
jgi:hypothetical protein